MLSGIGPAEELSAHGIRPIVDLPVGKNLQDHAAVQLWFKRLGAGPFRDAMRFDRMALGMIQAHFFGTGVATVVPGGLYAYVKTRQDVEAPNMSFMFRGAPADVRLWLPGWRPPYEDGFGIRAALLHPRSRGQVRLQSTDARIPPLIRFNLLSDDEDLEELVEGFEAARTIAYQQPMDVVRREEIAPGPAVRSRDDVVAWIRKVVNTANHPCATCAMGPEPCVLDPELRVRGMEGLRVVDASAMPDLVSGNINACVLMLAEKAADLIRDRSLKPAPEPVRAA
jgi:choline dehydrogenase-like flavoprotein